MHTFNLDTTLLDFEEFLLSHTPKAQSFHPHFQRAVWEMVRCGGKRFRPALMLSVIGNYPHTPLKESFYPALAMEILHTFSLIHDDLPSIDNAPLRRGNPTLHTRYGEVTAILSGDFLNSYAFYLLAMSNLEDCLIAKLVHSLSKGACKMIVGEALDCEFEGESLGLERVEQIHCLKTAYLIATSLQMGAIIARVDRVEEKKLWDFGMKLGVFFQIRDDLIDAIQSSSQAGKPTQKDKDKNSYVTLLGLQGAKREFHSYAQELQSMLKTLQNLNLISTLETLLQQYWKEV
ncbi:polyprenyl synthetase family protein [Helicobacter cholecystus]|uniref:Polyprenyl synthetase family protein n=1 Tax=Helicobacter cholecystus TaxID=45498 RepID=A0A3D8IVC0_9HELI|nr:polyprenyl synthetase family protein [Helicobacter cholecystus]RDU68963.1 polyprenyl synthetase family protein [Helicobacter cholecystus]VEJ26001.1 geranyltranstransferase [Helicobacter cholecystus]